MIAAPDLTVSIVTYNSAACLDRLAHSIAAQQNISFELFLVDNASQDQSPALLSAWPNANITLNPENIGFGRAHNQNLPNFRGRYLLLLNPDLEFGPHLFAALRDFLDANPAVGIAGPTIIEGEPAECFIPRKFYPGEGMFPLEPGLIRHEYAWLSGACLAIRRNLFESLNGFDPNFFLYQEETDLCLRARRDICTEWLSLHNLPHWPTATALGSILSRQAALAWRSLTTDRFPLDDY